MNPLLMKHTFIYPNIQRTRALAIITCVHTFGGIVTLLRDAAAVLNSCRQPVSPQILLPLSGSSIFQPKIPTPGCSCKCVCDPWGDGWVTYVQCVFLPLWLLGPCLTGDIQMGRWTDTIGSRFSLSSHFTSLCKYTCHYRGLWSQLFL